MTRDLIDDATVERCAKALDASRAARHGLKPRAWLDTHPTTRTELLADARAVLAEALQPAPTHGPLDGQEPLTGETA